MRKILSLLIVMSLFVVSAYSQTTQTVSGKIISQTGEPVPFATITEQGTSNRVSADADGNYSIKVRTGAKLAISSTGFGAITVDLADASTITLSRTGSEMTEVVVTALGVRRQPKELGYATAKVTSAQLTQGRAVNLEQGLTGKVSGLNITTVNNSVFENTKINLRGIRSLTGNNQPLLVVDGTPTPLNYISSLNPNDVQDVNILKGASAAAIYGPDGVNGVIIVTTKRGSRDKPTITISNTTQLARVAFLPKWQTRFGSGSGTDAFGRPVYTPFENQQYGPEYDGTMVELGPHLEDGDVQMVAYSPTNERKKFWNENGLTVQNDFSFSTQDVYISVQDAKINGLMPKDENRRTSFRFNAQKEYNKFKTGFNINYIAQNFDVVNEAAYSGRFASSYNGSIYYLVMNTAAHVPLTKYKNWREDKYAQYGNWYNEYTPNPYWVIDNHRNKGRQDDLIASMNFNYNYASWLNATLRVGTNLTFGSNKAEISPIISSDWAASHRGTQYQKANGSVGDGQNFTQRINTEFFFNGKKDVSDFGLSYILGGQFRQDQGKNTGIAGNNLIVPFLFNVGNRSGELGGFENNFKSRLLSAFGSFSINYKGWATVEVVGRNDWDSRLNPEANSYFYPGVNASLVLSDAIPLIKSSSVISYAKLRGSVTKSGNVNLGVYSLEPTYFAPAGFPFGSISSFSAANLSPDPNIQPEFVNSKEIGFELSFLKSRIGIEATLFHQKNTNQILTVQQSQFTGFPNKLANTADFINKGIEMDLNLSPLVNVGKGRFDLRLNATYNDNEVTSLFPGINALSIGGTANFTQLSSGQPVVSNAAVVGMPAFVFQLTDYKRDDQGRVIIDKETGLPQEDPNTIYMGRTQPLWIVGINPSFSWSGLSIGMTWDYKGGHNAFHGIGSDMDFTGISKRSAQFARERFVFPNSVYWDGTKYVENTDIQVSDGGINFWTNGSTNAHVGTNYFTSAAAWKLRELSIAYELPKSILGNGKVLKRAVIALVGRNLLTFLPESNEWTDPEFNYNANNNTFGINSSYSTPPARTYGASISLTF